MGSLESASLAAPDARLDTKALTTTTSRASAEGDSFLGQPHQRHGRPVSAPDETNPHRGVVVWGDAMRDAQADVPSAEWLRAQLAFKNSMVHGILQFTPSIAFCYVLHRCVSRDIRCRESFMVFERPRPVCAPRTGRHEARALLMFCFPWHMPCRGLFTCQRDVHDASNEAPCTHADGASRASGSHPTPSTPGCDYVSTGRSAVQASTMILPQVHLRKPCYDFSFL